MLGRLSFRIIFWYPQPARSVLVVKLLGGRSPKKNPFLALQSVLEPPGDEASGLSPAVGFAIAMAVLSVLLNGWGVLRLRAWNPRGEPIMQRERPETIDAFSQIKPEGAVVA